MNKIINFHAVNNSEWFENVIVYLKQKYGHDGPVQHRLRLGKSQPQPLPGLRIRKLYRQSGSLSQVRQHPHRQEMRIFVSQNL